MVTFIVTSYNYEKYILRTLESIKSQIYKNFEIIVVDDASSDNSCKVVEQFIADNQDLKITLIKNKKNIGQLGSMIEGLKSAQGQFVSFIDSDDIILPEFAQCHVRVHMETSVAFTSCRIAEIGENDELHTLNSISSPKSKLVQIKNCDEIDVEVPYTVLKHKRFGGWYWSPTSSAMFRKASIELIKDYKNIDKWKICPDKFLFNFAHLVGGSAIIDIPLTGFRRHLNNAGNSNLVTGDKKFHSDKETIVNLSNNIKIRPETIKFLWQERKIFGKRNTAKLILTASLF